MLLTRPGQRWVRILRIALLLGLAALVFGPTVTFVKFQIILYHPDGQMRQDVARTMLDDRFAVWLAMRKMDFRDHPYALWILKHTRRDIDDKLQRISASETEELGVRLQADSILYYRTRQRVHLESIYAKIRKGGDSCFFGGRLELRRLLMRQGVPYEEAAFLETSRYDDLLMTEAEFSRWLDGFPKESADAPP
jgi:hypothetical protein